jgi:hypothetical protein
MIIYFLSAEFPKRVCGGKTGSHAMKKNASNDGDPGRIGCRGRCSLERYCLLAHS